MECPISGPDLMSGEGVEAREFDEFIARTDRIRQQYVNSRIAWYKRTAFGLAVSSDSQVFSQFCLASHSRLWQLQSLHIKELF
jgi:hypothetical protein